VIANQDRVTIDFFFERVYLTSTLALPHPELINIDQGNAVSPFLPSQLLKASANHLPDQIRQTICFFHVFHPKISFTTPEHVKVLIGL
jgi:hypothetical protein